jgi:hypothetical protein
MKWKNGIQNCQGCGRFMLGTDGHEVDDGYVCHTCETRIGDTHVPPVRSLSGPLGTISRAASYLINDAICHGPEAMDDADAEAIVLLCRP